MLICVIYRRRPDRRRVGVRRRSAGQRQEDRHQSQAEDDQHDDHDLAVAQVQVRVPERLQPDLWLGRRQGEPELRQQVRDGEVQLRAQHE